MLPLLCSVKSVGSPGAAGMGGERLFSEDPQRQPLCPGEPKHKIMAGKLRHTDIFLWKMAIHMKRLNLLKHIIGDDHSVN